MKETWQKCVNKLNAMAVRERIAVFIAALAVIAFFANALFIEPAMTRKKALVSRMDQQRAELRAMQGQLQALEQRTANPDAAMIARRDGTQHQIAEIEQTLRDLQHKLVPAQSMKSVLQDMLARNSRLQLVAMRSLPVGLLVEKSDKTADKAEKSAVGSPPPVADATAATNMVFKHGVQITLQGSYGDLHDYLARLEKLPWRMFWSRASLNASDYPRLTLTVTIYTLSLDKAWLVV